MSQRERTGTRDLAYSRWHRTESLKRFIGVDAAVLCSMIDVDGLEFCARCRRPLALVEVCFDVGQKKSTIVLERLAEQAGVEAYVVYYRTDASGDIASLRVGRVWPDRIGPVNWTPSEWARKLKSFRRNHQCSIKP